MHAQLSERYLCLFFSVTVVHGPMKGYVCVGKQGRSPRSLLCKPIPIRPHPPTPSLNFASYSIIALNHREIESDTVVATMSPSDGKNRGSKRPSPTTVIDLTLSDDDNSDTDSFLEDLRTALDRSKFEAAAATSTATSPSTRTTKKPKIHHESQSKPASKPTSGSATSSSSSSRPPSRAGRKVAPPKSAYDCFYEAMRSAILQKNPGTTSLRTRHVRKIQAKYASLSVSDKLKWEQRAKKDKIRYKAEMEAAASNNTSNGNAASAQGSTPASTAAAVPKVKQEKVSPSPSSIDDTIVLDDSDDHDGKPPSSSQVSTDDDDDIEIVDSLEPSFVPAAASATGSDDAGESTGRTKESDVVVMGAKNSLRLPHSRQHCTEHSFTSNEKSGNKFFTESAKYFTESAIANNSKCCDLCYCFVCDVPSKECKKWNGGYSGGGHYSSNHCCATDKVGFWVPLRQLHRQTKQTKQDRLESTTGILAAESSDSDEDSDLRPRLTLASFSHNHFGTSAIGQGPFRPDDAKARDNTSLTKCRKCGWFNKFKHANFRIKNRIHEAGSSKDWCMHCGRVSSIKDFEKAKSHSYANLPTDISLGEKVIPFRIRAHDPREFTDFKQSWIDGGYTYKVEEMETDAFHHRLGKRPTIEMILHSLPLEPEDKIPTTGKVVRTDTYIPAYRYTDIGRAVCAEETEAVIIENRNHQKLIHALHSFVDESNIGFHFTTCREGPKTGKKVRKMAKNHGLRGDVVATWDEGSRSGVRIISFED